MCVLGGYIPSSGATWREPCQREEEKEEMARGGGSSSTTSGRSPESERSRDSTLERATSTPSFPVGQNKTHSIGNNSIARFERAL